MKTILKLSLVLLLGLFTNQAMAQCNASFTSNATGQPLVSFTNTSTPPNALGILVQDSWTFGDGSSSYATNPSHIYNATGTYNACLIRTMRDSITYAILCADTICNTIQVSQTSNYPCEALFSAVRDTANFTSNLGFNFFSGASYAGGGTITSYAWDFGDNNTSTAANPTHAYATAGQYNVCLTITTSNNCSDNYCLLVDVQPTNPAAFSSYLAGNIVPAPSIGAMVYLIEYNATTQSLYAIASTPTMNHWLGQGTFTFANTVPGTYLVKAAYHSYDPAYATHLPTYYSSDALWSGGTNVTMAPSTPQIITINMLSGTPTTGPGFIGGSVVLGANKTLAVGDPKHKLTALLFDVTNNKFIAMSRTNGNGEYSFSNVPVGDYKVFIEELGKTMTAADITISASNANFSNVNFESNTTENHPMAPTSLSTIEKQLDSYSLKTNPVNAQFEIIGLTGNETVKVLDLKGKIMKTYSATQNFDVQGLSAGIYLVNIENDGQFQNMKLVIAK